MYWKLWSKSCQSDLFQDRSVKGGTFYVSSAKAFGCYWPPNIKRFSGLALRFLYSISLCQECELPIIPSALCDMYPLYRTARHSLLLESSQCTSSTSHSCSRAYHLFSSYRLAVIVIKCQKLWRRRPCPRCLITLLGPTLELSLPSRTKMSSENRWLSSNIALKAVSFVSYWFSPPSSTPSQVSFTTSSLSSPTTSSSSSPTPALASRESSYDPSHSLSRSASPASSPSSVYNEGIITSRGGMFPNARGLTFNNCIFQDITSVQPCPNHGMVWPLRAYRLTN